LTYTQPPLRRYGKQYKSKIKRLELIAPPPKIDADEKALERFRQEFAERKQKRTLEELKTGGYE